MGYRRIQYFESSRSNYVSWIVQTVVDIITGVVTRMSEEITSIDGLDRLRSVNSQRFSIIVIHV